jgi:putative intracellular protease/amidase
MSLSVTGPGTMNRRIVLWSGLGVAVLPVVIGGGWILSLPSAPAAKAAPPVTQDETNAMLTALRPPKRQRPLIAIVGANDGSETTDYLMPFGILRRADVADVIALGTEPGPVTLYPALKVEPQASVAEFDARHPDGADHVIVPAMHRDDDPTVLPWIRSQATKGAIIIGVCAGAKIVGAAGLLDGKRATTHWYYVKELCERHPAIRYVADRRLVVDTRVATTTGITASMPMSLTLIEAIAGRDKAETTARDLGLAQWDANHDSDAFTLTRPFALTAIGNRLAFWNREQLGIQLVPGVDEVSLALVADTWSRTYRSRAVTGLPPLSRTVLRG